MTHRIAGSLVVAGGTGMFTLAMSQAAFASLAAFMVSGTLAYLIQEPRT